MLKVFNPLFFGTLVAIAGCQQLISLPSSASSNHPEESIQSANGAKNSTSRYQLTRLSVLENAFNNRLSNIQVLLQGRVTAVLSDDLEGSRHQRFIIQLPNSQTLLVAHNIDLAPRVSGLTVGDQVYVYGEYEWNSQGGVIHWTHHDPNKRHVDGWIERNGVVFR